MAPSHASTNPLTKTCLVGLLGLLGCHADPPPSLAMAETNSGGVDELPAPDDEIEADPAPATDGRALWFADGPGREAILARERRDHASAVALLDQLLADANQSATDRAAAELLRAFEDLRVEDWSSAADRLARVRNESAFAPIEPHLRMLEAQARLDAKDSSAALELVRELEPSDAVPLRVLVVRADAHSRAGEREQAIELYRRFLAKADGREVHEARRKLAALLLEGGDEQKREAAELYEQLLIEVPLSDYGREAEQVLANLLKAKVVQRTRAEQRELERRKAMAEVEGHLDRREYGSAAKAADKLLERAKALKIGDAERCTVLYAKGSAIFKQRKRSAAQPVFDTAAKHCARAGNQDLEVKTRYQAARGVYADGEYQDAAARFESVAADYPDHSYADDSLIKAGEAWESAGEPDKARAAYERSLGNHPDGDMRGEALRRLMVQDFAEKRVQDALDRIEAAIKAKAAEGDELAKLHYFRGKALDQLGRADEAEKAWLDAIATRPLCYPSLQAISRLRERGEDSYKKGLDQLNASVEAKLPDLSLPQGPAAERVRIWVSLGLGEHAQDELERAGIDGWPAVAALAQAGLHSEAQKRLASLGTSWREAPPIGERRGLWELAHPLPFHGLVAPGEKDYGVPELLTYAIMQTESRFDPGATSYVGARGLIQLMPATAETVASKAGLKVLEHQLYDPATNLSLGQRYLAGLTARWGNVDGAPVLAVPSYNAGPGRTDQWSKERAGWELDLFVEAIPFDETRHYTQSVLGRWAAYRWLYGQGDGAERLPYLPLTIPARAAGD